MHIAEGILSAPVLGGGAALAAAGVAMGLKRMDYDRLPQVALMTAVFFVASLVHLPLGPASVHLVMNGLVGLLLGWAAFPALFVGLVLQAILFQHGGLTTLGVNTLCMALPAVIVHWVCSPWLRREGRTAVFAAGFAAGAGGVLLASLLVGLALYLSGEAFLSVGQLLVAANLPVALLEGLMGGFMVAFLKKVRPAMLCEAWSAKCLPS